ncbi:hypothetical protein L1987_07196 [Smallanthus sonchifolius]|uniref:Uncharacterized protein n=1 Tax=Smallanthus sonchifolius TaxID=185202 RepID=A0ACB9K019_9ASTR|nr:hypothetical protein L1987_07196 [Smallanthus sonchifolius]
MTVPSHLRSTYFNPNFTLSQRRNLFPGIGLSSSENSPSNLLTLGSTMNLNQMLQTKHEMRDTHNPVELSETEESLRTKRRPPAELDLSSHHQMGNYLMQSSTGPMAASHPSVPANFWMAAGHQHQVMNGDPIWTFPNAYNSAAVYRGTVSSGLHFMNFPTPVTVLPGQQLGVGSGGNGGGNGGGGGGYGDGQLNMLSGLNSYRPLFGPGSSESPASASHGGGDDRHDTTSHNS